MKLENRNMKIPFGRKMNPGFKTVAKFHLNLLENYIIVDSPVNDEILIQEARWRNSSK